MSAPIDNETAARIRAAGMARTFVGKPGDQVPSDPLARTVTVYDLATGKPFLVWPVDARQMCASGAFSLDPPDSSAVADEVGVPTGSDDTPTATQPPPKGASRRKAKE